MDILRNKTRTWKVSNQQHIFQKMADPILYMSLRLPSNSGCADPSLIQRCFSKPKRSFSRLLLSFATCEIGLNWRNANKTSQRCSVQHLEDMQTWLVKLRIIYMRHKRWSIVSLWRVEGQHCLVCHLKWICSVRKNAVDLSLCRTSLQLPFPGSLNLLDEHWRLKQNLSSRWFRGDCAQYTWLVDLKLVCLMWKEKKIILTFSLLDFLWLPIHLLFLMKYTTEGPILLLQMSDWPISVSLSNQAQQT